jgi:uroporphyrinogen decarboxylase
MTSKQLVYDTLAYCNKERAPRCMGHSSWSDARYPNEVATMDRDYPGDFLWISGYCERTSAQSYGNSDEPGRYVDDWGCIVDNLQQGIVGEVKVPLVSPEDEEWNDTSRIHIPVEWLTINKSKINKACKENEDKFLVAGACPRPFEQLQFIRGTENLYIDLITQPPKLMEFLRHMHDLYCEQLELWGNTDVDMFMFMDDWGSQRSLLINPEIWIKIFKPLYKDYVDIAHRHGKKILMHSDGYILDILPHLIEIGVDFVNSQIFCIGMEKLEQFKGKFTFWGEIDRQDLLPNGTLEDIENAVESVYNTLWKNGGCIAQCEFGPSAKPENVRKVFETWDRLTIDRKV